MNENNVKLNNEENVNVKPTFKERLKKIPVKKVLKIVGIAAGAIGGTIVLGKIMNPKDEYYQDPEIPFDDGATNDDPS